MAKQYRTAAAFKTALEAHLRTVAQERNVPFQTLQLKFVIERLLARLFRAENPPWLLKGGFAMELRFRPHARTTKDVDLSAPALPTEGDLPAAVRDRLQEAAEVDLGDHLTFRIGEPTRELTNAPQGGARFPCEVVLVGKVYQRFHIDVGCGDALCGEPEPLTGDDLLAFAGIPPALALAIPTAQQFAEKLHAYTFPWEGRVNTRTKDLVDLVLLLERRPHDPDDVRRALRATFATRNTHPLPPLLAGPPSAWAGDYALMAAEAGLQRREMREGVQLLTEFWAGLGPGGVRGG